MKSKTRPQSPGIGVAALAVALNASGEIQLTPAGEFRGIDGRPADAPAWVMDAQAADKVIAFCSSRPPVVLDYEHQTLFKEKNGQPAPAAGWFTGASMAFREGEGLFAKVELTERAKGFIASGEYKFVSPVLFYEKGTGRVVGLHSAALTNTPAIDGMDEVIAIAAASLTFAPTTTESLSMDIEDLLEQLRWLLNLPTMATKDEVLAELLKAVAAIKQANATEVAAANFSLAGLLAGKDARIAELSAATPDPAKFVSVDVMNSLRDQLAALTGQLNSGKVEEIVEAALTAGKLLPVQKDWAISLGRTNFAALTQHLESAPQIAALVSTQTGGKPPKDIATAALTADEAAMCRQMGISEEAFIKTKQAEAAQA